MIIDLLRKKKVVKFKEIQNALGTASRATTFRYLREVQYMRSYNYNSCYYSNRDPTLFDRWGLYSYGDICFSRDGKLDKTVTRLVLESEAGLTQRELQDLLNVRVQVLLLEAVRHKKFCRDRVGGFYLYLHNDLTIMESQLQVRRSRIAASLPGETKDSVQITSHIVIEVLLVLIRHPDSGPSDVAFALRGPVPSITVEQVESVFTRYSLEEIRKKKDFTDS